MKIILALLAALSILSLASPAHADVQYAYYADTTIHDGYQDFPVGVAAANWNLQGRVILKRVPTCVGYSPCVTIKAAYLGTKTEVVGYTSEGTKEIVYNVSYTLDAKARRGLVCHEFGHYLGVPHGPNCMAPDITNITRYAGEYNRTLVRFPDVGWN